MTGHRYIVGTCLAFGALGLVGCSGPTAAPPTAAPRESVSLVPDPNAIASVAAATNAARGAAPVAGTPDEGAIAAADVVTSTDLAAVDAVTSTTAASPAGSGVDAPLAEPIGAITDTLTYVDPTIGYAVDYPASWSIEATPGSIVLLTSFDLEGAGRGGLGPGDAKIDIVPDLEQGATSLEQLALQTEQTGNVVSKENVMLAGDIPAVLVRLDSPALGGDTAALVAVVNGRGVRLHGYGNLALFEAIARSLRSAE